jgi:hypothetical protein
MVAHEKLLIVVLQILIKIKSLLSSIGGWCLGGMTFLVVHFGPTVELYHWIIFAVLLDLIFGAWSALKRHTFHISFALVSTAIKLVIYATVLFMPIAFDNIILVPKDLSGLTIAICVLLVSAEFWSTLAHIIVIWPGFVGVKWVQRLLMVEISKKLDMTVEEFDNLYFKKRNKDDQDKGIVL